MAEKVLCPCCGLHAHIAKPGGHSICPICKWQDDNVQRADPDFMGGANKMSLNQARALFAQGKDKRGNPILLPLFSKAGADAARESVQVMANCTLVLSDGRAGVLV